MRRTIKTVVKKAIGAAGFELRRKQVLPPTAGGTFADALSRLGRHDPGLVKSVIDVGASDGRWSRSLMSVYPSAEYLLIEAQPVHEPGLKAFCAQHPNTHYVLMAAGDEPGSIYFDASDPFGGVASDVPMGGPACIRVPVTTIDDQVELLGLSPPYLIKLDVHGYELPILGGAERTISRSNICIIECYNFPMSVPGSLLFPDMCRHLAGLGFRCADMYDLLNRPKNDFLWQMDILFMRADRPEFSYTGYQ